MNKLIIENNCKEEVKQINNKNSAIKSIPYIFRHEWKVKSQRTPHLNRWSSSSQPRKTTQSDRVAKEIERHILLFRVNNLFVYPYGWATKNIFSFHNFLIHFYYSIWWYDSKILSQYVVILLKISLFTRFHWFITKEQHSSDLP